MPVTEATTGRETVQIVELVQPLCTRTFGVAPCTATGTADEKCFNTRATCADPDNFLRGSGLSLYFSTGVVAARGVPEARYIIPSLVSVSTQPTRINLGSSDADTGSLGYRAVCNIEFQDHPHSDRVVDPYLSGRTYDPMKAGSFWTKWMVRNLYRYNMTIRVYEGYIGQPLSQMVKRSYILTNAEGPDESGRVRLQGKDILARIEERKASTPNASPGLLRSDITATQTNFEVVAATSSDYPSSGTLRINDEVMTYQSIVTTSEGIRFAGVGRGSDGTSAESHSADDGVQECVRYTEQRVDTVVNDLLDRGGVDSGYIDSTANAAEIDRFLQPYRVTRLITEPTPNSDLLAELQEQCGFYIWWDEREALIRLKAIRGVDVEAPLLTDGENILRGSFSVTDLPSNRISQLWYYYNLVSPVDPLDEPSSYTSVKVQADLASESDDQYGEASVKRIYGTWGLTSSLVLGASSRIIRRYSSVPRQSKFRVDAKDRAHWVGDVLRISHFLEVDAYGQRTIRRWTIISAEEVIPGETVEYVCEDTTLYGQIYYIQANGSPDYPGAATAPFAAAYIGDNSGLLSDGLPCARIT